MQSETIASSDYTKALQARMRVAREAKGYTQKDMANLLRITKDAYEKYETRSRLPHHLMEPFALGTDVSLSWLVAGRELPTRPRTGTSG
jgi:transcriptional regulator with XRE-family HTH domain